MSRRAARALALLAVVATAAAVALAWGGCGGGVGGHAATGGTAGAAGGSGDGAGHDGAGGSAATSGAGGSAADSGLPYPGAEPCEWDGWYRAPMLAKGCLGVCIPDDVAKRVDPLVWQDRPDWCPGCKTLATPWAPDGGVDAYHTTIGTGITAIGKPDLFGFTQYRATTDGMGVVFDATGHPKAAWRDDLTILCGRSATHFSGAHAGLDIYGTAPSNANLGDDLFYYRTTAADVGQLMVPGKPTFTWPGDFIGMAATQGSWFDDDMVAEFFADVALAYPSTGDHFYVSQLPGAPGGEWSDAQVVGKTALVSHYDYKRMEWYTVTPDKKVQLFLGAPDRDISALATDGHVIVWKEGHDPVTRSDGSVLYQSYALYSAPYTADPAKLVPRLLLSHVERSFGLMHIANGFVEGVYYVQVDPYVETAEIVVRLSDGRAWLSDLPDNMNWSLGQYPGATELWGAVTSSPTLKGQTLARVPYASMQVLQDAAPDGGITDAGAD